MATDFQAIGSALYSALGGTAGTVFYGLAPQGYAPPYAVFNRMSADDEYTFNSAGVRTDYLVAAISNREWPGPEAYPRYATLHALIQDKHLTVTGYTALRCRRVNTVEYRDQDGYWHVGGVYRVDIWDT